MYFFEAHATFYRPSSLANVENQWSKEVQHFCKTTPVILVGNKIDLRQTQNVRVFHKIIFELHKIDILGFIGYRIHSNNGKENKSQRMDGVFCQNGRKY